MYIRRDIKWKLVFQFAWKYLIFFLLYSSAIVWVHHYFSHTDIKVHLTVPFLPISTIGIAVAFYIGFKNNQAYDRFWEARKIWGGIINYSRTWGNHVMSFITNLHASQNSSEEEISKIQERLIYRHIAWCYALTHMLRQATPFSKEVGGHVKKMLGERPDKEQCDKDVAPFLSGEEYDQLKNSVNLCTQLIRAQGQDLTDLRIDHELIDDFRHMEMMKIQEEFYNLQGKCERINNTPFPRQFAYFSKLFTWIFILIMPFGLLGEFEKLAHNYMWLTIPFYITIAWIFITMELVGDTSEDPFENFVNDVPMTALTRVIERDLRQMLGEEDLPPKIAPIEDVLM